MLYSVWRIDYDLRNTQVKEFVPISELVRISEIALFLLRINSTNICNSQIWVILLFIPF